MGTVGIFLTVGHLIAVSVLAHSIMELVQVCCSRKVIVDGKNFQHNHGMSRRSPGKTPLGKARNSSVCPHAARSADGNHVELPLQPGDGLELPKLQLHDTLA